MTDDQRQPDPSGAVPRDGEAERQHPLHEEIRRGFDVLERKIAASGGDKADLRGRKRVVQRLRKAWERGDGSAAKILDDTGVRQLHVQHPQTADLFVKLRLDLGRQQAGRGARLERLVHEYCEEVGQPCHGRYPRLTIAHFVEVSVNDESGRTKVGNTSLQTTDWTKVRAAVDKEVDRVWGRPFTAEVFRDEVLAEHETLSKEARNPTGFVRLMGVFRALRAKRSRTAPRAGNAGRLLAYYKDEFCADLSKLWRAQVSGDLTGQHLEFSSIRQAQDGFSVVLPGGGIGTYGFVKPKR